MIDTTRPPLFPQWLVYGLLLMGILISAYMFFQPYNLMADEEVYLQQAITLAHGEPNGWNLRSFLPQFIIAVPAALMVALGIHDPAALTMSVRLMSWLYWWAGLVVLYLLARRAFDKRTALLAVGLLLANWVWMLSSKRVMMDVPGGVWILIVLYLIGCEEHKRLRAFAIPMAAGMATATKFQLGPLAAVLCVYCAIGMARQRDWKHLGILAGSAVAFTAAFGLTDRLIYGQWFDSLKNFYIYTFQNTDNFAETYGPCGSLGYYLKASPDIFSYLFPPFILLGIGSMLLKHRTRHIAALVLAICAYLLLMHSVCHKLVRYLVVLVPLLTLAGAHGLLLVFDAVRARLPGFLSARPLAAAGLAGAVGLIAVSMVPRTEVAQILESKESCADFVYGAVLPALAPQGAQQVIFAVPCGMPPYALRPIEPVYGGYGYNEHSRITEIRKYRATLGRLDTAVVARNSELEKVLFEEWGSKTPALVSEHGEYAMYRKR